MEWNGIEWNRMERGAEYLLCLDGWMDGVRMVENGVVLYVDRAMPRTRNE